MSSAEKTVYCCHIRDHISILNNNNNRYTMQCHVALKFGRSHGCVMPDWSLHDKSIGIRPACIKL